MTVGSLAGRVAVVTGGTGAIGAAIAGRLAGAGASVVVADLRPDEGILDGIQWAGGDAAFLQVDVTQPAHVRRLFTDVDNSHGRLDVLVLAAGIPGRGRIEDVDEDLWDRVLAVNLSAVYWCCRYALPALRRSGSGRILTVASVAGLRGWKGSPIYSASKAGAVMLTRSLAADHAAEGIRAFALCPTATDTPLLEPLWDDAPDPAAARAAYERDLPGGRLLTPDEIAGVALSLAGPDAPPFTPDPFVV
jgi:NAD(P)-dependent dehydrogenase (short-subunit alcohol dehydrogenase family)